MARTEDTVLPTFQFTASNYKLKANNNETYVTKTPMSFKVYSHRTK
jgi:hypothetical protein